MSHNRRSRLQNRRDREGAVMLIVLLILLTATALAGVSLQASQFELRAAGQQRAAVQTQYVSEAAMATTMAWVDATSSDRSILQHLGAWAAPAKAPDLSFFGEPELKPENRRDATRTQWRQQARLTDVTIPPITAPGAIADDAVGTFGPRVGYQPGVEDPEEDDPTVTDYVVDMYDCRRLSGIGSPGSQVNFAGSGTVRQMQLYCVVTSRGRSFMWEGPRKVWETADKKPYPINRFATAHDSRGTIVSPPIVIQ